MILNDGQIQYDDPMGQVIATYAKDIRFSKYLEIGTWNGGGSTYCFMKGFEQRNTDISFNFVSLEINEEMYSEAKEKYKNIDYINLFLGRILTDNEVPDINTILETFESVNIEWLRNDINNLEYSSYFDTSYNPEVVLLDGSEYLTYFEFKKLYDTTKVFILDDINSEKCRKIVEELRKANWLEKHYVRDERNGWAVYEKL